MQRPHSVEQVEGPGLGVLHDVVVVGAIEQSGHLLEVLLPPVFAPDEGGELVLPALVGLLQEEGDDSVGAVVVPGAGTAVVHVHDVDVLELVIHLVHRLSSRGSSEKPHHQRGVVNLSYESPQWDLIPSNCEHVLGELSLWEGVIYFAWDSLETQKDS